MSKHSLRNAVTDPKISSSISQVGPTSPSSGQSASRLTPTNHPTSGPLRSAVLLIILFWGLSQGRPFILPLLIAGLVAFIMAPLHRFLVTHLRLPELISVALSALTMISPVVFVGYLLVRQGQSLVASFPELVQGAEQTLGRIASIPWVHRFLVLKGTDLESLLQRFSSEVGKGLGFVVGGLSTILSISSQGLLIFVFSILMLASRKHLRYCADLIVSTKMPSSSQLLNQVIDLIQKFLTARIFVVILVGAAAAASLALFQVQYSLFLGALFGLSTLIPAVGFFFGAIPILMFAAITGHTFASILGIFAVLLFYNALDNYFFTPKLVGNRVNVGALPAFVGLFAGGLLWGIWGMFLSIPILGILRIIFSATPDLRPWGVLLSSPSDPVGESSEALKSKLEKQAG